MFETSYIMNLNITHHSYNFQSFSNHFGLIMEFSKCSSFFTVFFNKTKYVCCMYFLHDSIKSSIETETIGCLWFMFCFTTSVCLNNLFCLGNINLPNLTILSLQRHKERLSGTPSAHVIYSMFL